MKREEIKEGEIYLYRYYTGNFDIFRATKDLNIIKKHQKEYM